MHGGSSDNPNVATFVQGTVSIRAQGSTSLQPLRGNAVWLKLRLGIQGETCHHALYQTAHFSVRFPQRWPF